MSVIKYKRVFNYSPDVEGENQHPYTCTCTCNWVMVCLYICNGI